MQFERNRMYLVETLGYLVPLMKQTALDMGIDATAEAEVVRTKGGRVVPLPPMPSPKGRTYRSLSIVQNPPALKPLGHAQQASPLPAASKQVLGSRQPPPLLAPSSSSTG